MKLFFLALILCFATFLVSGQNKSYISTKNAIEDIDYLVKTIEKIHYNPYFLLNKEAFNKSKDELINNFNQDSITLKKFVATGMKLVAKMSGGHTAMDWKNVSLMPELTTYNFIPFTGILDDDKQGLIVTRSVREDIKKGVLIKSINGISIVELYKECMTFLGGIDSYKKASCEKILPLYLYFTEKTSAPYSIEIDGIDKKVEARAITISELIPFLNQNQSKENYTFEITEDNIGLLHYNSCSDYNVFRKFLKSTFKILKTKKINKLIIDIRENSGGNSSLNDLLLSYITDKPYRQSSGRFWKVSEQSKLAYKKNSYETIFGEDFMKKYYDSENQSIIESFDEGLTNPTRSKNYFNGKTCFLIGPNTFSSANFLADAVKTYNLSTLIGTSTGEYTNDFGEQIEFQLPHSGNYIYVSSTYDIGANGNLTLFEPVYPDIRVKENVLPFAINWIKKN
ncbi:hypothetical protein FIA58_017045 [Flavobacterium jejuense]|uniref:Tail specific protease domain-containing protein n=1 Tax=Flavobacterium jejuense TaxID=1544455 RepID=A0ABX0IU12_9FLAO|nr:S41 family peptidase [Flavobacterium jejuense]NHN27389.1 hypothetical protein [Flavobacterium jejuense]